MFVLCLYCNESRPTMNQIGDQGRPKEVSAMLGAWITNPVKRMGQQSQARALIITRFYFFKTNPVSISAIRFIYSWGNTQLNRKRV